jgi:outer membrane protein assembly factor BamA
MKKSTIILALGICSLQYSYAQEKTITQDIKDQPKKAKKRVGELSFAYTNESLDFSDKPTTSARGLQLHVGRSFDLNNNWRTTSVLSLRALAFRDRNHFDLGSNSNFTVAMSEIGLSQRISYRSTKLPESVVPFMDLSVARGALVSKIDGLKNSYVDLEYRTIRYGAGAGLLFPVSKRIVPFIKYQYSRFNVSGNPKVATNLSETEMDQLDNPSVKRSATSQSSVIGFNVLF